MFRNLFGLHSVRSFHISVIRHDPASCNPHLRARKGARIYRLYNICTPPRYVIENGCRSRLRQTQRRASNGKVNIRHREKLPPLPMYLSHLERNGETIWTIYFPSSHYNTLLMLPTRLHLPRLSSSHASFHPPTPLTTTYVCIYHSSHGPYVPHSPSPPVAIYISCTWIRHCCVAPPPCSTNIVANSY